MRARGTKPQLKKKVKNLATLKPIIRKLKADGKVIVFTNGCFDILHYGHVKYLEDARQKGDYLVVAINSDSSIKRTKGKTRPIINQADRAHTIAGLESVDYVVLFNENTPLNAIKALKPDVLVKGADWNTGNIVGAKEVRSYGGNVSTIKLIRGRSTTNIINKISGLL